MHYLEALDILHQQLKPGSYIEIGCRKGVSLARSRCPSIAIDPDFEISQSIVAPTRFFNETSDYFFANRDLTTLIGGSFDLAFIDGMHKAEYALRDFINLERHAHPGSVIIIDDVLPQEMSWTTRERQTQAWTGDVYKIIPLLREARPDLNIVVFDVDMKGMAVIHNLTASAKTLAEGYEAHEAFLISTASELASVEKIRETIKPQPTDEFVEFLGQLSAKLPLQIMATNAAGQKLYLDLLKRSLLNEIYLDDELRLLYLRDCLDQIATFDHTVYHDIRGSKRVEYNALKAARDIGQFPERNIHRSGFSHTMMGRQRLDSLHHCLNIIRDNAIRGDVMECGVWRGGGCILMAGYLKAYGMRSKRVLVADSFDGLPTPSAPQDNGLGLDKAHFPELAVTLEVVRENFAQYDLLADNIVFLRGWFAETLEHAPTEELALLRLDGDLYESTMDCFEALYDKVVPGGIIIVDDYGALQACREAVADFFTSRKEPLPKLHRIDWTGVYWMKQD